TSPLTIADLAPGPHAVSLEGPDGSVKRSVTLTAGDTVELNEPIFSGFVSVFAPFELTVSERGRVLRLDEHNQVMLSPGPHSLRLVNGMLLYDQTRQVEVKPGETTRLTIPLPRSTITVTATEPAEVWLDGVRAGDAPVKSLPIDPGTHEVMFKR